ncbi:MAG: hypothetical protein RLZZ458_2557 [Planctomycetota bacterium]
MGLSGGDGGDDAAGDGVVGGVGCLGSCFCGVALKGIAVHGGAIEGGVGFGDSDVCSENAV